MPEIPADKNIFIETLEWICGKLESAGISYMITGGAAVGFWGHIRTTMDIDIVIQIYSSKVEAFLKAIENDAYIDITEARRAISQREMFNVILNETCFKVDIIALNENSDYEVEKFSRRTRIKFRNNEISVIAPEDLIISKLLWSKAAGGSERQFRDCESICKLNSGELDTDYLKKWAKALKLEDEFNKLAV